MVSGIFENNGTFGKSTSINDEITVVGSSDDAIRNYVINNGVMYLSALTVEDVSSKRITEFTNAGELYLTAETTTTGAAGNYVIAPNATFENTGAIYGENAEIIGGGSFVNTNGDVGCKVSTATITGTMSVEEISGKTSGSRTYGALQELVIPEGKTWTISKANEITINGKLTVYGTLVVEGTLIIAGAGDGSNDAILDVDGTVTVAKDATLQIGKIANSKNYKASATIDGTFNLDGKLDLVCTPIDGLYGNYVDGFAVVGSMTVSKTGAIFKDEGIMTVYGDLTVNGSFDDAVIVNKGVITIDNSKAEAAGNGEVQIGMYANGAVLNIDSFKFVNSGTEVSPDWNYIQVTDKGAILKAGKSGDGNTAMKIKDENANYFVIDGASLEVTGAATLDSAAFTGKLVITESISSKTITIGGEKATQYTNKMDVSGSASTTVSYTKDVGASADDTVSVVGADMGMMGGVTSTSSDSKYKFVGGVEITDELTIGKYLRMVTAGVIDVSGTVSNLVKGSATIANGGEITVTGLITTLNGITGGVVNAAYYEITTGTGDNESTTKNYSAFASAVDAVTVEGNTADKIVEVMGKITIKENVTVPAGVAVIFDSSADTNTLTVGTTTEEGRAVTVTFAKTATMRSASEQVIVNGTLTFEDKTNDLTRDTVSDVTVEDEAENGKRTYTNIFTAIQNSSAGQTITVTKETGNVEITQSLTIPEGVTLYVPADAVSIVLDDGVTLTIDGTLMTELDVLAETMFGTSAMDLDAVEGGADAKRSSAIVVNGYMLVSLDVATSGLKYDNSTAVAGDGYSSLIAGAPIYGAYYTYDTDWAAVSPVDKAIAVIDKISDKIVLNGPITLGDIAFTGTDDCDEIEVSNKQVNNVPAGGVAIDTVVTANSVTIVDATFDVIGTFNGSVVVGGATVTFVDVSGFTAGFNTDDEPIVTGSLSEGVGEVDAAVTLAAGSLVAPSTLSTTTPFTVASGATLVAEGATFKTLKVAGTVSVESNKVLNVNVTDAVLSILEGGVLDVAAATDTTAQGTVNVITLDVGMDSRKETTTGAVATINGPVNVTSKAFVVAGSNVSTETQTVLDKMYSTQYNVDGALWMTVYAQSNAVDVDAVKKAPVENAWFGGWENAKGDKATGVAHVGADDWKVVDAIIKTDVYKVFVYANEGIANVYIDGNLMQKGTIGDVSEQFVQGYFLMVAAGEHKITYDLTNGWTGTAAFKVNGDTISGNAFTTSGTPKDSEDSFDPIVYNVQISGLEKSGYVPDSPDAPAESGMGITDYLLIILVVLIVVMAIIVAMRLMRS
ncbi:beta strand repeat-containing protein [Candidatus Methanoprimaticola sp. MG2]|uniref:beta strand repeat-containing protein n=1 Tax=Candidatus Methanoprimaticola sp. MG2 TaxID=3228838 RepID=UPI0039C7229E